MLFEYRIKSITFLTYVISSTWQDLYDDDPVKTIQDVPAVSVSEVYVYSRNSVLSTTWELILGILIF